MRRQLLAATFIYWSTASLAFAAAPLISPWIVNPANGHSYALTDTTDWVRAEVSALSRGGHLTTIRNQAERDFVYQTFGNYNSQPRELWIGLHDTDLDGTHRWTSGEPVSYTNWAPGEPNGSTTAEQFVATYYPGHSAAGQWNDWGHRNYDPIGVPFGGVIEVDPDNPVYYPIQIATSPEWKYLAPEGSMMGQDINAVGQAFEAAHPDWNTNLAFDTSNWAAAELAYPAIDADYIWGAPADAPVYFRHTFQLDAPVTEALLLATIDDYSQIYINGQLVASHTQGGAGGIGPLDIAEYLHSGENLIAIKTQNIGGPASLTVNIFAVPEPSALALALTSFIGLVAVTVRRKSRL
jgi:hypothetical protein